MTGETVVAPVVAEPTTPIKPSEALRLGRLLRPRRVAGRNFAGTDGACAIGSIMAAGGVSNASDLWAVYPGLMRSTSCPLGKIGVTDRCHLKRSKSPASFFVTHLNDAHSWSDDQIVAWLESLRL